MPLREPVRPGRARRVALFVSIVIVQFAVLEAGMRTWGGSEASPSFQALFMDDPAVGYRLRPGVETRFRTSEFTARIAINENGVRDDRAIGPKPAGERRIVVLGDSLVLAVQVDFEQTFTALLEERLNRQAPASVRYRVINAGVQGYGPVEELLFFRAVARHFEPDIVLVGLYVGNDAEEALAAEPRLLGEPRPVAAAVGERLRNRMRRIVRRSMVLQVMRLRVVSALDRLRPQALAPAPPAQSYAANPPPRIARGIAITTRVLEQLANEAGEVGARTGVVLMPARFQVDDGDYGRLREIVREAGGELVRDAATVRFDAALERLPMPRFDLLPDLRAALPGPDLYYQQTAHFTPRGHVVVAAALERFLAESGLLAEPAER